MLFRSRSRLTDGGKVDTTLSPIGELRDNFHLHAVSSETHFHKASRSPDLRLIFR
jgi:hypothetical protein